MRKKLSKNTVHTVIVLLQQCEVDRCSHCCFLQSRWRRDVSTLQRASGEHQSNTKPCLDCCQSVKYVNGLNATCTPVTQSIATRMRSWSVTGQEHYLLFDGVMLNLHILMQVCGNKYSIIWNLYLKALCINICTYFTYKPTGKKSFTFQGWKNNFSAHHPLFQQKPQWNPRYHAVNWIIKLLNDVRPLKRQVRPCCFLCTIVYLYKRKERSVMWKNGGSVLIAVRCIVTLMQIPAFNKNLNTLFLMFSTACVWLLSVSSINSSLKQIELLLLFFCFSVMSVVLWASYQYCHRYCRVKTTHHKPHARMCLHSDMWIHKVRLTHTHSWRGKNLWREKDSVFCRTGSTMLMPYAASLTFEQGLYF